MSNAVEQSLNVSVADVVAYLRIEGGFSEALAQVVRRKTLLHAADQAGIVATAEEIQRAADAYRAIHGLHKATDTVTWMRNNGITTDTLERHLEENIRISKARDHIAEQYAANIADTPAVKALIRELSVEGWLARTVAE
ncbi:MAG: hypothetical protein IT368_13775 [Candidatus Hydrogenedentes bacterium]|nr:hypothetical protein [Candidatus Hydrogenedentota bacterium]